MKDVLLLHDFTGLRNNHGQQKCASSRVMDGWKKSFLCDGCKKCGGLLFLCGWMQEVVDCARSEVVDCCFYVMDARSRVMQRS